MTYKLKREKLKQWMTTEFGRPPNILPSKHRLEGYQLHIRDEAQKNVAGEQRDSAKKKLLRTRIKLLRTEITSLDSRFQEPDEEVVIQEDRLQSMWAKVKDYKLKEMLLYDFWLCCVSCHKMLTDYTQKTSEKCAVLEKMDQFASSGDLFYFENYGDYEQPQGNVVLEPPVLSEVTMLRDNFLQNSKQNAKCIEAIKNTAIQDATMTKWLDDVQNVWGNYLPSHLLASLRHFALKEQFDLKQKTASLDQETGASAQAPDFKEDHKLDMPTEEDKDLPPVNPLVEDARKRVKKLWVALAKTRSRVQTFKNQLESCEKEAQKKISDQFPNDSSTLLVFKVDLHRVMRAEIRDHIKKCGKELEQSIECEPQKHLRMKHGCVVALTQKLKKSKKVIKNGNETILMFRTQIVHFHTELQELIHTKLVRLIEDIITSARLQKNAIVKEARQLQITPLTSLDRRNVEGERRIPALQLSINHLQSQAFNCLCQKLKFPLYKTPQELWASLYSKQLELRWLHCNMKLSSKNLQKTIEMAPWLSSCDDSDCLSRLTEADAKHLKSVTFKANYLVHFLQTSHRLKCRLEFFMSIWLRQPAKHAQPWKSERGRTYAEWLKRWNRALASL